MVWRYVLSHSVKILILGILAALTIWAGTKLVLQGQLVLAIILVLGAAGITYIYFSQRTYPLRYLVPGLVFLLAMVVFPIGYTVYVSFTNMSTGHLLSKDQVIAQITGRMYVPPNAPTYSFIAFQNDQGERALLLENEQGDLLYYHGKLTPVKLPDNRFIDKDNDGTPDRFLDYHRLSLPEVVKQLSYLKSLSIPEGKYQLRLASLHTFTLYAPRYSYDPHRDVMTDLQTGKEYYSKDGFFYLCERR